MRRNSLYKSLWLWLALGALSVMVLAISPWGAEANSSQPQPQQSQGQGQGAGLDGVPLKQNWWANVPNIDPATKISYSLTSQFTANPNAEQGFMVYMKAQADTSNSITDWNAKGEYVLRQLERVANATQPSLMQAIDNQRATNNVSSVTQFTIINAVFVRGKLSAARELARRDDVAIIEPEHRYDLHKGNVAVYTSDVASQDAAPEVPNAIELGVNYVKAPQVWALGYRGQGIVVGSIDTGVDYLHPALNRQYRGNLGGGNYDHNYNWFDTRQDAPRQNVPYDDDGHGTHTTGTVLGEDASMTNQIGVAPGAKWIAAKVFPGGGSSGNAEITVAEDFMLAPWDLNKQNRRPDLRPHVINNSWGDGECWNTDSWMITQAWIDAGIMPAFSNGNSGPPVGTVGSPAAYPFIMGVGAISASSNVIAGFSSRGPSCYTGGIKPDVVAPGVGVRSAFPNNTYGAISGTSMAAPHASGVIALMLSANSSLTYTDVTGILTRTAFFSATWGVRPNNNYGWGAVQADTAVDMALHGPHLSGTVSSSMGGGIHGAMVTARRTSDNDTYMVQAKANGAYSATLRAGTYDLTASAFSYMTQTVSGVVLMTDTNPVQNFTLAPMTTYPVGGQLFMGGSCVPISGTVRIEPPGWMTVTNTMPNGFYNVNLPAGTYTLTANAGAYLQPITNTVTVAGPVTQNFTFGPRHDNGNTYVVDNPGYNWIAGTTQLTFDDGEDGYSAVTLPFPVTFYTGTYTTANVSTNGYLTFNDLTYARMWANMSIPQPGPTSDSTNYKYPNNGIYPYWDDMSVAPRTYGNAYTGVTGSAPNRIFTIEWRGVAGIDSPATFAVQIEETTNRITLVYQDISGPYGYGYSATEGIENADGTDGIQLGFNWRGIVGNNMAVRFSPGSAPAITPCAGATATPGPTGTATSVVTVVATSTATRTSVSSTATATSVPTATPCTIMFSDVPVDHTFYPFIRCLACRGIISGYADGTFKPGNEITRGQIAKMVSNAAGFSEDPGLQIYEDVNASNTFYVWINRLSRRGHMGGYACGTVPEEPCVLPQNRPYFRPYSNATRGQLAKIVSNAAGIQTTPSGVFYTDVQEDNPFYVWIMRLTERGVMSGYECGGVGEPCDPQNRPYFRPFNNVTRGQASKIVANTFYPGCETSR